MKALSLLLLLTSSLAAQDSSSCTEGCLKCEPVEGDDSFKCARCDSYNFYYEFMGNSQCEQIEIRHCEVPSVSQQCERCIPGHVPDRVSGTCVKVAGSDVKANCERYDENNACILCALDHFIDGDACTAIADDKKIRNCAVYSSADKCDSCAKEYFLTVDADGVQSCQSISLQSNCWRYSAGQCDVCKSSFVMNKNFWLDQPLSDANLQSALHVVNDEFLLSGAQGSVCASPSDQNCTSWDSKTGACLQCTSGFFLNGSGKCAINPEDSVPNCGVYSAPGTCTGCKGDYYLSGSTCMPVSKVDFCEKYQVSSDACLECESEYFVSGATCAVRQNVIIPGCMKLNMNADSCMTCKTGYVKSSNQLKCFMQIANCTDPQEPPTPAVGQAEYICNECAQYHYPSSDGSMCEPQFVANCQDYTDNTNTCSACLPGFHLDGQECKALEVDNCQTPDTSNIGQCSVCHNGFYKDATNKCHKITVENCDGMVTGENKCSACQDAANYLFYKTAAGECLPYDLQGCATPIATANQCDTCESNFTKVGDVCLPNPMPGCDDYNFTTKQCTTCAMGYYKDSVTNLCQLYSVKNCNGQATDKNECSDCNPGYYEVDGNCIPFDLPGCNTATLDNQTSNTCANSTCMAGFYTSNSECYPYTFSAETCDTPNASADECTTCKGQTACTTQGTDCGTLFYKDTDTGLCFEKTLPGCKELIETDSTKCHECLAGFFQTVDNNSPCQPYTRANCKTYEANADECATCITGHSLDSTTKNCLPTVINGCVVMDNGSPASVCTHCAPGMTLGTGGTSCEYPTWLVGCAAMNSSGHCTVCDEGFFLASNICNKYTINLEHCLLRNPTADKCAKCLPGYVLNGTTFVCEEKVEENCYQFDTSGCTSCNPGFVLGSNACTQRMAVPYDDNCLMVKAVDTCDTCKEGFEAVTMTEQWSEELNCESFNTTTKVCDLCQPFYKYDISMCVFDDADDGCIQNTTANKSDAIGTAGKCGTCKDQSAHVLTMGNCTARDVYVDHCGIYTKDADTCSTCAVGYPLLETTSQDIGICQKKPATNLKTQTSSDNINCATYPANQLAITSDSSTALDCLICKPGFGINSSYIGSSSNPQCEPNAAVFGPEQLFLGTDRSFKPIVLPAGESPIGNCARHGYIYVNDLNYLRCIECEPGYAGLAVIDDASLNKIFNFGGGWIQPLGEYDIYAHGFLYASCFEESNNLQKPGNNSGPTAIATTIENCETYLDLQNGLAGYSVQTDLCYKCKTGYAATVVPFTFANNGTTDVTGDAFLIKTHFHCAARDFNLKKQYKGMRVFNSTTGYTPDLTVAVAHDTCKDGSTLGVFAKKIGTNYYPTDTSVLGNVFEVCSFDFSSTIANCQINIMEYNSAKTKLSEYSAASCLACKPGYKKTNWTTNSTCSLISNCNLEGENTWMGLCQTCDEGYIWKWNSSDSIIEYDNCVYNQVEHCMVIDGANCKICEKGYDLVNNKCLSIVEHYSDCGGAGYPIHALTAADSDFKYNTVVGFFLNFYRYTKPIVGCASCDPGYTNTILANSHTKICSQTTQNIDPIPNCKQYEYDSTAPPNTTTLCYRCEDGYTTNYTKKTCQKVANYKPGCIDEGNACTKCDEGYTRIIVIFGSGIPHCIQNEHIRNPSINPIFNVYFKPGFRPMDWTDNANIIITIEEENECAEYAANMCIKCKKTGHVPMKTYQSLAENMPIFKCVPYNFAETVYPAYLEPSEFGRSATFSFKTIQTTSPVDGMYVLKTVAAKMCLPQNRFDPACQENGVFGCKQCAPGFYVDIDKLAMCQPIPQANCVKRVKDECVECQQGFWLNTASSPFVCTTRTKTACKEFSAITDQCSLCHDGYHISTTGECTKATKANCAENSPFGNYCMVCAEGYYNDDGTCTIRKNVNCKIMFTVSDNCKVCEEGFYLKGGACHQVTAQNCMTHRADVDQCVTCPKGLFLDDVLNCSPPEQNHCTVYHPFEDKCLDCPEGFFLKDGDCLEYTVRNCLVFHPEHDSCLKCGEGQFVKNDNTAGNDCRDYSVRHCSVADPFDDKCLSCLPNHYNKSGSCIAYSVENCLLFNPFEDQCLICQKGFVLGNGSHCLIQTVQNCKTFFSHVAGCAVCDDGFFADPLTNKCKPYTVSKCNTFSRNSDACLVCSPETYLNGGKCISYNAQFCRNYHPYKDQCLNCREGFYMDDTSSCQPYSLKNCIERNEYSNTCVRCEEAHYLDQHSLCQKHSTKCEVYDMYRDKCLSCPSGSHWDINRQCQVNTVENCKTYIANMNECQSCLPNKWKSGNFCYDYTAKNCKTFKPTENLCEDCVGNGYYKNPSGSCIPNSKVDNCGEYSSTSDQCAVCAEGYYKVSSSECRMNPTGVKNCREYEDKETCKRCKPDYYLTENTCMLSSTLVNDCIDYIKDGICSLCDSAKILDFNNSCVDPVNTTCATYEDPKNCKTCAENQVLRSVTDSASPPETTINCEDSGIANCKVAKASGSSSTCEQCKDGHILSNNTCNTPATTITDCLQYEKEGECARCVDDRVLSADKKTCDSDMSAVDSNCLVGHLSEKPQCYQCAPGYWFNESGSCEKCGGDGCDICSSDGKKCQLCKKGFYMTTQLTCHAYSSGTNRVIEDEGSVREASEYKGVGVKTASMLVVLVGLLVNRLA